MKGHRHLHSRWVEKVLESLELDEAMIGELRPLVNRYGRRYPAAFWRSPEAVVAGAVYVLASMTGRHISQSEVASACGVSASTVSRIAGEIMRAELPWLEARLAKADGCETCRRHALRESGEEEE